MKKIACRFAFRVSLTRMGLVSMFCVSAVGCGGGGDDPPADASTTDGSVADASASDGRLVDGTVIDGRVVDVALVDGTAGDAGPSFVVRVNEIVGHGPDWFELHNTGASAVSLDGYKVADLDETTMGPKLSDAATFPVGTSIPAGGYIVVVADQSTPLSGPQTACESVANLCYHAKFGISPNRGDKIHLLAPGDILVTSTAYPAGATPGTSYGYRPDGTLGTLMPTPGTANLATP